MIFRSNGVHLFTDLVAHASGGRMARLCDGDVEPLLHEAIAKLRSLPVVYKFDESEKIAATGMRIRKQNGFVDCAHISGNTPHFKIEFRESCQLLENEEFFVEYEVEQRNTL